jgi:hypothetical protein
VTGCATGKGTITMHLANGLGGAPVLLLLGATQTSVAVGGGCTLLVPPVLSLPGIVLGGAGAGNGAINVSATLDATVPAVTLTLQAAIGDAGSPLGFSMTNGVQVDIQ